MSVPGRRSDTKGRGLELSLWKVYLKIDRHKIGMSVHWLTEWWVWLNSTGIVCIWQYDSMVSVQGSSAGLQNDESSVGWYKCCWGLPSATTIWTIMPVVHKIVVSILAYNLDLVSRLSGTLHILYLPFLIKVIVYVEDHGYYYGDSNF